VWYGAELLWCFLLFLAKSVSFLTVQTSKYQRAVVDF